MKKWFETRLLEPPQGVVTGRFGSSVMFVAFDKWRQQWQWIYPGGSEKIAEPAHIFVDEEWALAHILATPRAKLEKRVNIRRKKGAAQLELEL